MASVDSIPTSAAQEDHVPMGPSAARKAARIVDHVTTVLAIEVMCAAQALDLLRPLKAGGGVEAVRKAVRRRIAHLDGDRVLAGDIEKARGLVSGPKLREAAEKAVGRLS